MLLILARHGNTFNKGEKIYRVGNSQDLPLVEKGLEQAEAFASALLAKNIKPAAIYCGPLHRTKEFADIIAQKLKLQEKPIIDKRLDELSYGAWAGLTEEEIKDTFRTDLELWEMRGDWPKNSKWLETENDVNLQVKSFAYELTEKYNLEDVIIAVSSNGKIRYFLKLIEHEFENRLRSGNVKVGTGHVCIITYNGNIFKLVAWNIDPAEL